MNRTAPAVTSPATAFTARWHTLINRLRAPTARRPALAATEDVFVQAIALKHTLWIDSPRGRRIVCEAGAVWLTFDGQLRDIVLEAGQQFVCDSGARLAIYALSDARVRVQ